MQSIKNQFKEDGYMLFALAYAVIIGIYVSVRSAGGWAELEVIVIGAGAFMLGSIVMRVEKLILKTPTVKTYIATISLLTLAAIIFFEIQ